MKKIIKTVTGFMIGQSVNDIQESRQNQRLTLRRETTHKAFYKQVIFKAYGSCNADKETKHLSICQEDNRPSLTKVNDPPRLSILKDKMIANGEINLANSLNILRGVA